MNKDQFLSEHIAWCWKIFASEQAFAPAVFGAGKHTVWLLEILLAKNLPLPSCIIDENCEVKELTGVQVLRPENIDAKKISHIFLSTDVHQSKFLQRINEIFPDFEKSRVIDFYDGFPPGPYEKNIIRKNPISEQFKPRNNPSASTANRPLNICISRPLKNEPSESFIKAHLEKIPGRIFGLHGDWLPVYTENDIVLASGNKSPEEALLAFLQENKIDVFLAEYGLTGARVYEICERAGIPLLVYFLGFDANDKKTLDEYMDKYLVMFKKAYALLCVSEEMRQKIISMGAAAEKVYNIPCGVDLGIYEEATKTKYFNNRKNCLAIGRFVDKKAPYLSILAFKEVRDSIPDAKLIFYGNGDLFETCKGLIKALNLENSIELRGYCKHSDLPSIMEEADIFIQHSVTTSYGDSEGSPVILIEAGAAGLPVVSTKHAGINEIVKNGETGILVDEYNIKAMAESIIKLLNSPELRLEFGTEARKHISEYYSMDKNIAKLYNLMQNGVNEKCLKQA